MSCMEKKKTKNSDDVIPSVPADGSMDLWLFLLPSPPLHAAAENKGKKKEESEELDEDMGFDLFDQITVPC